MTLREIWSSSGLTGRSFFRATLLLLGMNLRFRRRRYNQYQLFCENILQITIFYSVPALKFFGCFVVFGSALKAGKPNPAPHASRTCWTRKIAVERNCVESWLQRIQMCCLCRKSGLLGGWRTLQDVGHFTGVVQATTRVPKRK